MQQNLSPEEWMQRLKDGVLFEDLNPLLGQALFTYLADLGVFTEEADGAWRLNGFDGPLDNAEALKAFLERRVREAASIPAGFALVYFMRNPPERPEPEFLKTKEATTPPAKLFGKEPKTLPRRSSDPSNLQIVKKVGRQLQSFIEMENQFIEQVQGCHTTRQAARRIFNAVLEKIGNKAERRDWEQLSRRRHK